MKIAIIGSRDIKSEEEAYQKIKENIPKNCTEIVSGGAVGIDSLAEKYADDNQIRKKIFLPDYEKYGKRAPLMRNEQIIEYCDMVLAFWDIYSTGTAHSIKLCIDLGRPVKIIPI